jgi:hypothetical protein
MPAQSVADVAGSRWFKLVVAVLSSPVAIYLFDWAGFEWSHSLWGWVIFMSSDAGLTSFVGTVLSVGLLLLKSRQRKAG